MANMTRKEAETIRLDMFESRREQLKKDTAAMIKQRTQLSKDEVRYSILTWRIDDKLDEIKDLCEKIRDVKKTLKSL